MKKSCCLLFFFTLITAQAATPAKHLHLVYKNYLQGIYRNPQQGTWHLIETNRWLSKYSSHPEGNLSFNFAYYLDVVAEHLHGPSVVGGTNQQNGEKALRYRVADLNSVILYSQDGDARHNGHTIRQNLDRLNLELKNDLINLVVGRQNIRFGSSQFASAINIFNPFRLNELDRDQQDGVDGLRIRIPTGDMAELDFGSVWGKKLAQDLSSNYYGIKANFGSWFMHLLMMKFENNSMAGFDLHWDNGNYAFWWEMGRYAMLQSKDYWKSTTGFRIESDTGNSFSTEYHFDQSGTRSFYEYQQQVPTTQYLTNGIYPCGRQYLIPGINFNINDRWFPAMKVICNVGDGPCYWWPQIEYHYRTRHFFELGTLWADVQRKKDIDRFFVNETHLSYRYFF